MPHPIPVPNDDQMVMTSADKVLTSLDHEPTSFTESIAALEHIHAHHCDQRSSTKAPNVTPAQSPATVGKLLSSIQAELDPLARFDSATTSESNMEQV